MWEHNSWVYKKDKQTLEILEREFKLLNSNAKLKKTETGDKVYVNIDFDNPNDLQAYTDNIRQSGVNSKTKL
jgi:hypothetical protein